MNHLKNNSSGFALIMVIMVLLVVAVLASELTFAVRAGTIEGFNARQRVVGKGLAWSNHDAVSSMDSHRINVFHIANGDAVICAISHYFVFQFFPADN